MQFSPSFPIRFVVGIMSLCGEAHFFSYDVLILVHIGFRSAGADVSACSRYPSGEVEVEVEAEAAGVSTSMTVYWREFLVCTVSPESTLSLQQLCICGRQEG
jgi:hypothetical protein